MRRVLVGAMLGCGFVGLSRPPVDAQIPPRRRAPEPAGASRAADLADGIAVPANARSVRIEREGEVIRSAPDSESNRRGTASRGVRLPALEATQGHGCRSVWVRVGVDAWVCADGAQLSADAPEARELPVVPEGQVVPYTYAFATHAGVRAYRRLEDIADDNFAEELERGMSVAVLRTTRTDQGSYVLTASSRWVAMRDLAFARPSERAGVFYDPGEASEAVGFASVDVRAWPSPEAAQRGVAPPGSTQELRRREGVHIREERTLRGRRYLRLDAGWVAAAAVQRVTAATPPGNLGPHERWVDIDRARQTLVAYEGRAPVFAGLVSTGRPGSPTAPGEHRVWIKLAYTDMSNVGDNTVVSATALYTVARVPWVMFFHGEQGLHAAFWHDLFGRVHSHGCVNLAPRDAAWLYQWAPPAVPRGWTAVFPTERDPGMRVRVR